MSFHRIALIASAFIGCLAVMTASAIGQETDIKWVDYEVFQFISSAGPGPSNILKLDNNGDIILACTRGKTEEQLHQLGIEYTESQIALLTAWRLLRREGDTYQTTIPVLGRQETTELRAITKPPAQELSKRLKPKVEQLVGKLQSIQRERNTYSILFSYIVDGLVWNEFTKRGLLSPREVTADNPFWNGVVWAGFPPRDFDCGTNSISDSGIVLNVNWSEPIIPKMMPFVADWANMVKLLDGFISDRKVLDETAKQVFAPFNLFDTDGRFTIPVITESDDDDFYLVSVDLAVSIVELVPQLLDLTNVKEQFGFSDNQQCLVIIYHELMWDLMDALEKQGIINKPVAFADSQNALPKDIADLVFFVKGRSVSTDSE